MQELQILQMAVLPLLVRNSVLYGNTILTATLPLFHY
jgi:hypothetical protein